ncbi:hypothetical protein ACH5RR_040880 [Cinchona calisaya]|uniref:Uncharacterized protein n=1 Tax=Cinchona calisaya TaxID=153742 RepID=A0ABD2XT37_9GENT
MARCLPQLVANLAKIRVETNHHQSASIQDNVWSVRDNEANNGDKGNEDNEAENDDNQEDEDEAVGEQNDDEETHNTRRKSKRQADGNNRHVTGVANGIVLIILRWLDTGGGSDFRLQVYFLINPY